MRISKYLESYSLTTSRTQNVRLESQTVVTAVSSPNSGHSSAQTSNIPAAENAIDLSVYSAVDDFICLSGNDRIESYMGLSDEGRSKFIKIISKLVDRGELAKGRLMLDEGSFCDSSMILDQCRSAGRSPLVYCLQGKSA